MEVVQEDEIERWKTRSDQEMPSFGKEWDNDSMYIPGLPVLRPGTLKEDVFVCSNLTSVVRP